MIDMESLDTFTSPPTQEEKNIALLCHIGVFFGGIIVPLVVWLLKNDSPFVAHHAKESLNFQISLLIYLVVASVFILVVLGIFMIVALVVLSIVFIILATIAASSGKYYTYPLTIRFLK